MESAKPAQPEKPTANLIIAGRYEIIRELGAGGMGTVYLVRHINTDERLAMKVLRKEVANQAEAVERFKREMKASAILKSENVTRITDADTAAELDGALYMVMELLDGGDVERITRDGKLLDPSSVVFILAQASRALEKAHALGIIHRDLKPDTILPVEEIWQTSRLRVSRTGSQGGSLSLCSSAGPSKREEMTIELGLEAVAAKETCRKAGSGLTNHRPLDGGNGPKRDALGHGKSTTGLQVDDAPLAKDVAADQEHMDLGAKPNQRLNSLGLPKGGAIPNPNGQIDELGTDQGPGGESQVAKRPWPSQSVEQIQSRPNGKTDHSRFDSQLRGEAVVGWGDLGVGLCCACSASNQTQQEEDCCCELSRHSPPSWR